MRFLRIVVAALVSGPVVGCANEFSTLPPAGGHEVTDDYETYTFRWSSGTTMWFFYGLKSLPQGVAVCGVWTVENDRGTLDRLHKDVMSTGRISVNGTQAVSDLRFFRRGRRGPEGWIGVPSNCVLTELPAEIDVDDAELEMSFPRRRARV
ncbi:MAG: hypothetical protein AAGI10_14310 [Pseudomonadota bacterium]